MNTGTIEESRCLRDAENHNGLNDEYHTNVR